MRRRPFPELMPLLLLALILATVAGMPMISAMPSPPGDSPGAGSEVGPLDPPPAPGDQAPGEAPSGGVVPGDETPGDDVPGDDTPPGDADPGGAGASPGSISVPDDAGSGYYVYVSIEKQEVTVFLDGEVIREMVCSSGIVAENCATPIGRYYIQNRGDWFYSEKYEEGARWWVSFRDWGVYLFHSVPIDRDGNIIPEEAAKLGSQASHGCVRLTMENARWFYDTIPEGTPVDIE